jgi:hypothetical protein
MSQPPEIESPAPARRRFGRGHLIWVLLALSLLPGLAAAAAPEAWATVPAPVRMASYAVSGVLIAVGVGMIVTARN